MPFSIHVLMWDEGLCVMEVWDSFENPIYFQWIEHVEKEISVVVQV